MCFDGKTTGADSTFPTADSPAVLLAQKHMHTHTSATHRLQPTPFLLGEHTKQHQLELRESVAHSSGARGSSSSHIEGAGVVLRRSCLLGERCGSLGGPRMGWALDFVIHSVQVGRLASWEVGNSGFEKSAGPQATGVG